MLYEPRAESQETFGGSLEHVNYNLFTKIFSVSIWNFRCVCVYVCVILKTLCEHSVAEQRKIYVENRE